MTCCCNSEKRIIIVRGDDTDFNDGTLLTLNLNSEFLDFSTFTAKIVLGGITKTFDDISSGVIPLNYTANETKTLPYGNIDGALYLFDSEKRRGTIETMIPFKVISTVNGNAIATSDVDYTINVQQGGENILNITFEAGVNVVVGETETLPAGSEAYVENVGTNNHLVLNFGIPKGDQGEQGEQGEPGEDGPAGKDATINGYNSIALISGTGISIQQQGNETVINSTGGVAEWGGITGNIENQTDLQDEFATKQDVISDLSTIRSGATLGSTSLQPSDILNSVESTSTNKALSANMGKELQDQIDNLKARGRFLALWNCATGLAMSNPPTGSYTYSTGDYFVIGVVASGSGTNYRPDGSTYTTGVASTTVETEQVDVDDVYYYDGTNWRLQVNTQKTTSFINIAGDPYDNTALANALNSKQDTISDLSTIRSGASAGATAVQPADLSDYAKKNVAQTFTAVQTFNANVDIKNGSALKSESADMVKRDNANSKVEIGNGSDALSLNGSGTRPKYNNNDVALGVDITVTDVQVNGTSVVSSKVANILTSDVLPVQSASKVLGTDGTNISWDYGVEFIEWSD